MHPHPPQPAHVTHRRVTTGPSLTFGLRRLAIVPLVAVVAAVALVVGQRTGGQGDPADPAPGSAGHETTVEDGPPNPWAAGNAAAGRYLAEQRGSC